ncbi:hypothetical protein ACO0QE_004128 [Hanseniaspora vineae]
MEDQADRLKNYMDSLKSRKEDFVSGLTGSTIPEINYVSAVALTVYIAGKILKLANHKRNGQKVTPHMATDFALNWLCLLLAVTLYASNVQLLHALILIPVFLAAFAKKNSTKDTKNGATHPKAADKKSLRGKKNNRPSSSEVKLVKQSFLTGYRSHMLILTAIAILAVDFQLFPRKFAKVETWGTSLMDLGVGCFVFSNGVVSTRSVISDKLGIKSRISYFQKFVQSFKHGIILLALGLLRLYFTKNLEYQEHVTEYGVHWNFFMTLSLLPPFLVLIVEPIIMLTNVPRFIIALAISLTTEYMLVYDEKMLPYLIMSERDTLISANREGLWSFLGYCSIFLWGQTIGMFCLTNKPFKNNLYKVNPQTKASKNINTKITKFDKLTTVSPLQGLFTWVCILGTLTAVVFKYDPYNCSRRFANLPYVLWVALYNVCSIFFYALADYVCAYYKNSNETTYEIPESLEAINSNGLLLFLLANISTGLVNMSMNTLDTKYL